MSRIRWHSIFLYLNACRIEQYMHMYVYGYWRHWLTFKSFEKLWMSKRIIGIYYWVWHMNLIRWHSISAFLYVELSNTCKYKCLHITNLKYDYWTTLIVIKEIIGLYNRVWHMNRIRWHSIFLKLNWQVEVSNICIYMFIYYEF